MEEWIPNSNKEEKGEEIVKGNIVVLVENYIHEVSVKI